MQCLECHAKPAVNGGRFCSAVCRRSFNNRRQLRGAWLYDVLMVQEEQAISFTRDGNGKQYSHGTFDAALKAQIAEWQAEDKKAGRAVTTNKLFEIGFALKQLLR